jgi:chemotaxis protein methyltransferase CheR
LTGENFENREFEELKKNVKKLLGFNTLQYKDTYLGRRFNYRLRAYNLDNYHAYWELLKNDKAEQEKLLKDLTINVTEFFRDNAVYFVFKDEILPDMIKKKKGKIRIWSAGSSDGKEAYSIAMIAINTLGEQRAIDKIEIIGTDIDRECLETARVGIYESRPGIKQTDIEKQLNFIDHPEYYFDIKEKFYSAKHCLKKLVSFQYHDLISGPKKSNFDIIFCRNVVIYFNRELQITLYKDFFDALNLGGYFIMGKTETLFGVSKILFLNYNSKERIYRK